MHKNSYCLCAFLASASSKRKANVAKSKQPLMVIIGALMREREVRRVSFEYSFLV